MVGIFVNLYNPAYVLKTAQRQTDSEKKGHLLLMELQGLSGFWLSVGYIASFLAFCHCIFLSDLFLLPSHFCLIFERKWCPVLKITEIVQKDFRHGLRASMLALPACHQCWSEIWSFGQGFNFQA